MFLESLALAVALIVLAACGGGAGAGAASTGGSGVVAVGAPAPAVAGTTLDGAAFSLDSLRGRPVIVNFFASWCAPCRAEIPLFQLALGRHPDLGAVGVLFQDDAAPARVFVRNLGVDWPSITDPGERIAQSYRVRFPPQTFFVGRDGVVRAIHIGEIDKATLDEKLAIL